MVSQDPWDCLCGTGIFPSHAEDLSVSGRPNFGAGLPHPQRQSSPGRTGVLGPGWGTGHGSTPDGAGSTGRDQCPPSISSVESQAWAPPGWLRFLLWLKLPHRALWQQTLTERLPLPKVFVKPPKKGVSPPRPQSPQSSNPLLCEGIGGLLHLVSAEGIHLQ